MSPSGLLYGKQDSSESIERFVCVATASVWSADTILRSMPITYAGFQPVSNDQSDNFLSIPASMAVYFVFGGRTSCL